MLTLNHNVHFGEKKTSHFLSKFEREKFSYLWIFFLGPFVRLTWKVLERKFSGKKISPCPPLCCQIVLSVQSKKLLLQGRSRNYTLTVKTIKVLRDSLTPIYQTFHQSKECGLQAFDKVWVEDPRMALPISTLNCSSFHKVSSIESSWTWNAGGLCYVNTCLNNWNFSEQFVALIPF